MLASEAWQWGVFRTYKCSDATCPLSSFITAAPHGCYCFGGRAAFSVIPDTPCRARSTAITSDIATPCQHQGSASRSVLQYPGKQRGARRALNAPGGVRALPRETAGLPPRRPCARGPPPPPALRTARLPPPAPAGGVDCGHFMACATVRGDKQPRLRTLRHSRASSLSSRRVQLGFPSPTAFVARAEMVACARRACAVQPRSVPSPSVCAPKRASSSYSVLSAVAGPAGSNSPSTPSRAK